MISQLNHFGEVWWAWIWSTTWQISLLIVLIAMVDAVIRQWAWPQLRYALWLMVLVKLLLPPDFYLPTSVTARFLSSPESQRDAIKRALPASVEHLPQPQLPTVGTTDASMVAVQLADAGSEGMRNLGATTTQDRNRPSAQASLSLIACAMLTWLSGVVALVAHLVGRLRHVFREELTDVTSDALPPWFPRLLYDTTQRLKLRTVPRVLVSRSVATPAVFGLFRPVLLLPQHNVAGLAEKRTEHILLHELAHIKRGDLMVHAAFLFLQIVYWFNPLLWLARCRMQQLRELCCDAMVANILREKTSGYRTTLLEAAGQLLNSQVQGVGLLGIGEQAHNLQIRLSWLERETWKYRRVRIAVTLGAISSVLVFILPMAKAQVDTDTKTRTSDAAGTEETLETTTAAHLDRYGDPLPDGAILRMGSVRLRHNDTVTSVAFSPNGRILASAGSNFPVRLWNVSTGKLIRRLTGTVEGGALGLAFSLDGKWLATAADHIVRLWNVETGTEIWKREPESHAYVYDVTFSPDGRTVAVAGSDRTIRIWDRATGEELLVLKTPTGRTGDLHTVAYSPDGSLLAYGTLKDILIYDFDRLEDPRVIEDAHGNDIFSLAFTPDGRNLASGGRSRSEKKVDDEGNENSYMYAETKLWSVEDGELVREFRGQFRDMSASTISLSRDGELLASLHTDRLRLWNVSTGKLVRTISDYYNPFWQPSDGVAISPDKKLVAAIGPYCKVSLWDLETGQRKLSFSEAHEGRVACIACSPRSNLVASGAWDASLRLWDMQNGNLIRVLNLSNGMPGAVLAVSFSPDGRRVAAGGYGEGTGLVKVWDVSDARTIWTQRVDGRVQCLVYSADGTQLAAASDQGRTPHNRLSSLFIWAADTGQVQERCEGPLSRIETMAFSADGSSLTVVERRNAVSTWSVESQKMLRAFSTNTESRAIISAAFSPDRRTVVTSDIFRGELVWWESMTGHEKHRTQVKNTKGSIVAVSPNGALVASGAIGATTAGPSYDTSIHLWNAFTSEHLGKTTPCGTGVSALAFSASGRQVLSGLDDGTLLVWDVHHAME